MWPIDYFRLTLRTIVLLAVARAAQAQSYSSTTSTGLKIRIQADTAWIAFHAGDTTRSILKGDTLILTSRRDGASSTVTWLLGPDSSRVLTFDGSSPSPATMLTAYVMRDWEFARLQQRLETGVDGPTYAYNRPTFTSRVRGDTVWLDRSNGDNYRSVLRGDSLTVVRQKPGQSARAETWLIKGDSAYLLDRTGKVLQSASRAVVLAPRLIAEGQQINEPRPP